MATEAQSRRLWAMAFEAAKNLDLGKQDARDRLKAELAACEATDPEDLDSNQYEAVCQKIQRWGEGED